MQAARRFESQLAESILEGNGQLAFEKLATATLEKLMPRIEGKESVVALSSCEAEYIAASMGACQAIWLDNLMQELMIKKESVVELFVDNKSAISLAKHPVAHGRSKHIETRYHFLRDQVTKGRLKLSYCRTDMQVADIFTKAVKRETFKKLRNILNVVDCNEFV